MKRNHILLSLALSFSLFLVACNDNSGSTTGSNGNGTEETNGNSNSDTPTSILERPEGPKIKKKTFYAIIEGSEDGMLMGHEEYNEDGHMISFIDYMPGTNGQILEEGTHTYNAEGHRIKSVETLESLTTTTEREYYPEGKLKSETWSDSNGDGGKMEYTFNDKGEVETIKFYGKDGNHSRTMVYEYKWNEMDKIVSEIRTEKFTDGSPDKRDYHVTFEYDENGKLVRENLHDTQTEEIINHELFFYNDLGLEVRNEEYSNGKKVQYMTSTYNEYGELTGDEAYDEKGVKDFWNSYEYDQYGNEIMEKFENQDNEVNAERTEIEYWQ